MYGIVQQNNGAIEVQSRIGHGTTFYIYLPRATDLGKPAPMIAAATTGGNETILLVEDDDRVRALVSNMLRKNGYTVLLASAGDQALEIAARHRGRIHLLLTDVVMPGIERPHAVGAAHAPPAPKHACSTCRATRTTPSCGTASKSAAAHFIQKPFSVDALVHKIRETLNASGNVPARGHQVVAGSHDGVLHHVRGRCLSEHTRHLRRGHAPLAPDCLTDRRA